MLRAQINADETVYRCCAISVPPPPGLSHYASLIDLKMSCGEVHTIWRDGMKRQEVMCSLDLSATDLVWDYDCAKGVIQVPAAPTRDSLRVLVSSRYSASAFRGGDGSLGPIDSSVAFESATSDDLTQAAETVGPIAPYVCANRDPASAARLIHVSIGRRVVFVRSDDILIYIKLSLHFVNRASC